MSNFVPTSRLDELLASNDPPLDSESVVLRSFLEETSAQLSSHSHQYSALAEDLKRVGRIMHPARKLPAEIWGIIFELCLECQPIVLNQPGQNDSKSSLDGGFTPWILSHVSRGWRGIVHDHAILWSRIHLVVSDSNAETPRALRFAHMGYLLDQQLRYASEAPLTVLVGLSGSLHETPGIIKLLRTLTTSSLRWRSLSLNLHLSSYEKFLDGLTSRLPQLEELYILEPCYARTMPRRCFHNCPKLRHLSCLYLDQDALDLPLESLQSFSVVPFHLQVRPRSFNISKHLLSRMTNLRECQLRYVDPPRSGEVEIFTMPHLTRLVITLERREDRENISSDPPSIWDALRLPSLRTLEVSGYVDVPKIVALHERSGSFDLEKLKIDSTASSSSLSSGNLTALLRSFPTLKSLSLDVGLRWAESELIESLCKLDDSYSFLPSLQYLSLTSPDVEPTLPQQLKESRPYLVVEQCVD